MADKVILPESILGSDKAALDRLMSLLPPQDRQDVKLRRFFIFRMKIDGEEVTRGFILRKLADVKASGFLGSFYEFLQRQGLAVDSGPYDKQPPDETG